MIRRVFLAGGRVLASRQVNSSKHQMRCFGVCRVSLSVPRGTSTVLPPSQPVTGTEDVLADEIRKAVNSERVLDLAKMHHSVMNNHHLILTLELLFSFKKEQKLELSLESTEFQNLCIRLQQRARFFDVDDVVNVLKILSYLGSPTNSPVLQTFFQMLRHQVNELSIQQILYLEFLLKKQTSMPLVEALRIALPMVMDNQLEQQMDRDDIQELAQLFEYAVKHNLSLKAQEQVCSAIEQSKELMEVNSAKRMLFACSKLRRPTTSHNNVQTLALNVCTAEVDKISPVHLSSLMSTLSNRNVYYAAFCRAVCSRAVEELWPFMITHTLVCALNSVNYVDLTLLDVYAELVEKNVDVVRSSPKVSVHSVLMAFSGASHRPRNADAVLEVLSGSDEKLRDMRERFPELFLKVALNFAALDAAPQNVFGEVCKKEFVETIYSRFHGGLVLPAAKDSVLKDLLTLHQVAPTFGYDCPLPSSVKDHVISSIKETKREFPLRRALERALGGPQYVQTGVLTQTGVLIDHLLVLRKGNYPVAFGGNQELQTDLKGFNTPVHYIEDIAVPSDGSKVAVLVQFEANLAANTKRLTGLAHLPARVLAHEGYLPVVVLLPVWGELPEHERIPFIMREIRENLENHQATTVQAQ